MTISSSLTTAPGPALDAAQGAAAGIFDIPILPDGKGTAPRVELWLATRPNSSESSVTVEGFCDLREERKLCGNERIDWP